MAAKYIEIAERYDAGKLSPAQFDLEIAQASATANGMTRSRVNADSMSMAATTQAAAAADQAATSRQMATQSQIQSQVQRAPVTCTTMGPTTTCH